MLKILLFRVLQEGSQICCPHLVAFSAKKKPQCNQYIFSNIFVRCF